MSICDATQKLIFMEKYFIFMDWKTEKYYKDDNSLSNQQISCYSYQNAHDFFCRNRKNDPKIYIKLQGTLKCPNNLKQHWKTHAFWF